MAKQQSGSYTVPEDPKDTKRPGGKTLRKLFPMHRTKEKYSSTRDFLTLSRAELVAGNFQPDALPDVSVFRPEIISILNFNPLYSGDPKLGHLSSHGQFLEVSYQASLLRRDRMAKLYKSLLKTSKNPEEAQKVFSDLKKHFAINLDKIVDTTNFYGDALEKSQILTDFFDLKKIPENEIKVDGLVPLKSFYIKHMGFAVPQFNLFTGSKILLQLLADFKSLTEDYSLGLLDLRDSDRSRDKSSVNIDVTYTTGDFKVRKISSLETPINMTQGQNFNPFQDLLPKGPKDRIKVLITALWKEYSVSAGLGTNMVQKILAENFDIRGGKGSGGNPFDNILGIVKEDIFTRAQGDKAFSALAHQLIVGGVNKIPDTSTMIVLPFEEKYIDDEKKNKTFIPGKSYYINSIFDTKETGAAPDFNTGPLIQYVNDFSDRFIKLDSAYKALFNRSPRLLPGRVCNRFLNSIKKATENITSGGNHTISDTFYGAATGGTQSAAVALFRLANEDIVLKKLLFQYILCVGLLQNRDLDPNSIWSSLAVEFGEVKAFQSITVPAGFTGNTNLREDPNALKPHVNQIIRKIDKQVKTIVKAFAVQDNSLINLLENLALRNLDRGSDGDKGNAIQECIYIVNKITEDASKISENNYLLSDNTGRTRYNFLSASTQILMIFEVFSSMLKLFGFSDFQSKNHEKLVVHTNAIQVKFIRGVIEDMIGATFDGEKPPKPPETLDDELHREEEAVVENTTDRLSGLNFNFGGGGSSPDAVPDPPGAQSSQKKSSKLTGTQKSLKETMRNLKSKVQAEFTIIQNILFILESVKQRLEQAKTLALNTYNPATLAAFLQDGNGVRDLRIIKNYSQVRNSYAAILDAKWKVNNSLDKADPELDALGGNRLDNAIVLNIVDEKVREAVYSLTADENFRRHHSQVNTKILSVGIPAEFANNLYDRLRTSAIKKSSFQEKERDVVHLQVYKRDFLLDDLAFKPQKFIFDMSLYQLEKDFVANAPTETNITLRKLQNKTALTDLAHPKNRENFNREDIINLKRYDFLSRDEKRQMFDNHFTSFLLENYIKLTTGMKIAEDTFIIDQKERVHPGIDKKIEKILLSYIRDILEENIPPNQTTEELLVNPEVTEEVKDILRDFKTGNLTFYPNTLRDRILSPKVFDRIFHIPLNIDDFEVDKAASIKKLGGHAAWHQRHIQNKLIHRVEGDKTLYFLKPRTDRDIIFEDFFVVIENKT